jgi:N-acetylneuraminic acid mutarotase
MPLPRTEVAAGRLGAEIAVVGGFLPDGGTSSRADAYSPERNRWRRLPNMPVASNHAAAAGYRGRFYVVGGYAGRLGGGQILRTAFVLAGNRWRRLPAAPEGRAAAAAAVLNRRLYVVGGIGPGGHARRALVYDLRRGRWSTIPGPRPRDHLAAAAVRGRVYAIAGRLGGLDSNMTLVESHRPGERRWRVVTPVPGARGGTGAAVVGNEIVSVGGEEPRGTIQSVFALDVRFNRWRPLPHLPTPRHGLGVAAARGRVYAIAGGTQPGLTVSGTNEYLAVPRP